MEIVVGKNAGFCYGVSNAVNKTKESLEQEKKLYCLGELVHNEKVNKELKNKGLKIVQHIEEVPNGEKLIFRAHGVEKDIYEKSKEKGIDIIDLTCPKVLIIHELVNKYKKDNYFIILIGNKNHPEIIGTYSFCKEVAEVIQVQEDIQEVIKAVINSRKEKVVILSQTTISVNKFEELSEIIKCHLPKKIKVEVKNTICSATKIRQEETKQIAKQVDIMIIIGGKNSSNTEKLYDIAIQECNNAMCVQTSEELYLSYIKEFKKIGIMAGASTPEDSIKEIIEVLKSIEIEK